MTIFLAPKGGGSITLVSICYFLDIVVSTFI